MVMEKIDRPTRLIGFKSAEQITSRRPFQFGKRVYVYAAVLLLLTSVLTFMLMSRSALETVVLRAGGTLYQQREDGTVSNLYNAEVINKTPYPIQFELRPSEKETSIQFISKPQTIKKGESVKLTFFLIRDQKKISKYKSDIELDVFTKGKLLDKVKTTFIAPPNL
jgi:polyferredoxin